jgi:hypothetical protein
MRYLTDPLPPPPYVSERDLLRLASELGAGYFTAARLYDWYAETVKAEGREPVTKKWFGLALAEAGWQDSTQRLTDERTAARCWLITRPWQRRGDEQERGQ